MKLGLAIKDQKGKQRSAKIIPGGEPIPGIERHQNKKKDKNQQFLKPDFCRYAAVEPVHIDGDLGAKQLKKVVIFNLK